MRRERYADRWARDARLRGPVGTVVRLAQLAGLPRRTVESWVRGERVPTLSGLLALADGLKLPVEPVARACAAARARYLAARAAEQARRDALRG